MRSKKLELEDVVEQFEGWRAKPHGRLIPDKLWKAALRLLDRHAPSTICQHLRINPARFKQVREARGTVVGENRSLGRGRSTTTGRQRRRASVMAFAPRRNASSWRHLALGAAS